MNVDQLIEDVSLASLLKEHKDDEVFFSSMPILDQKLGLKMSLNYIQMPLVKTEFGNMGLFFSSKEDSRLGKSFSGMKIVDAVQMICDSLSTDGMIICGRSNGWVALRSDDLRDVLKFSKRLTH